VPEVQGSQRRNAAHFHCIVHRKRAGFGAQLPRSWRTADQSGLQSSYDPQNGQNKHSNRQKKPESKKQHGLAKKTAKKRKKTQKDDKNICRP
jgi:hypothetical protein